MSMSSQPTTSQSLGALLKFARDIMRKDKGLNGDLDRLPLLTWIMFLEFLDDLSITGDELLEKYAEHAMLNSCYPTFLSAADFQLWPGWRYREGVRGDGETSRGGESIETLLYAA